MEGCFTFQWGGGGGALFSRWGASFLSGRCAPCGVGIAFDGRLKKIVGWGEGVGACPTLGNSADRIHN